MSDTVLQRETEATDFAEELSDEALDRPAAVAPALLKSLSTTSGGTHD